MRVEQSKYPHEVLANEKAAGESGLKLLKQKEKELLKAQADLDAAHKQVKGQRETIDTEIV